MRTVNDFDGTFFGPVGFVVRDANAVNIFEMVLDGLGFNRRIRADIGEDFYRNKLFIDVAVSRVIDSMTRIMNEFELTFEFAKCPF